MKIVIRVDASIQIGTGHVMRCLTLAEALKQQGHQVSFICRAHFGHVIPRIQESGFSVHVLSQPERVNTEGGEKFSYVSWLGVTQTEDAQACLPIVTTIQPDWIIVDHYALDSVWHQVLRKQTQKIMVIDDLANRVHDCDLLLDQTVGRTSEIYRDCVPNHCQLLLGTHYGLLRTEFSQWRERSLSRRIVPELKRILITLGGVDQDNFSTQLLEAINGCQLPKATEIIVIVGASAPHVKTVQVQAKKMRYSTTVNVNVNNMAERMTQSDLVISAAGATTWEVACLGVPLMLMQTAENQATIMSSLLSLKAVLAIDPTHLVSSIRRLESLNSEKLIALSHAVRQLSDGLGATRVVEAVGGNKI